VFVVSYAVNPHENLYKRLLLRNYRSLATKTDFDMS